MDSRPKIVAEVVARLLRSAAAVAVSSEVDGEGLRARVKLQLASAGPAMHDGKEEATPAAAGVR
jgi:hypothetical protein